MFANHLLVTFDWAISKADLKLVRRAVIQFMVKIRTAMFTPAESAQFEKLRALARSRGCSGRLGQRTYRLHVIPIARSRAEAVRRGESMDGALRLAQFQRRIHREVVVLANEYYRKPVQSREIQ